MKIQIRNNTFETNSSSMHSLVIMKNSHKITGDEIHKDVYLDKNGIYDIWNEDMITFGRYPFELLSSPFEKFDYLLAQYAGNKNKRDKLIKIMQKIDPKLTGVTFPIDFDGNNYYGNIDHESDGMVIEYLEENNIPIEDFLTDDKYKVIIDGDEYCTWEKFKKAGLIDLDAIETEIDPYAKYRASHEAIEI